ncbi:RNA polymerase II holoenzyme cyclin-like subunit [Saitozyma podzolica]|uniref:RNA polymerase II holoenzyme cyclin-like subunit n=1 Tax=Saitozyma podzolica TaxID=1890683 RepID=A0A427YEH7_9TREE|nr:RNA polymerase II holoenzyme cyclin-like subunit [Saitozyma podzolica]
MSSNFWHSSHARYHLHPRSRLSTARATDLRYCTPRQHYCLGIWFANLIQKLGKRLLLRQIPIATATVFFRRFYLKNSICETNPYLVLAACVFVAAKVEETPVHIKSVVTEAKLVFAENQIKIFPAESHKLGEMEFYLLEDLDFHLIVFHPYRALLHICGREPADGGKFPRSRVEEDGEVKRREGERGRKREEVRKAEMGRPPVASGSGSGSGSGGVAGVGVGLNAGAGASGHAGIGAKGLAAEDDEEESEEKRIRRLMGRGTGEGLMEIEESVLQICLDEVPPEAEMAAPAYRFTGWCSFSATPSRLLDARSPLVDRSPLTRVFPLAPALALLHSFLLNDTYRTDVHLLYPPYVIALSALYIGFCLTALNNATSTRTRSSSSQLQTLASSIEVNAALGLPPPPKDAAAFIASFEVAMPVLLACVQDIVVLYPIWEAFEPTQRAGGQQQEREG